MTPSTLDGRQETLEQIFSEAFKDKYLLEALEAYKIGQAEYERAISALMTVQITSGTTSNPDPIGESKNANLDRDQSRN